MKVFDVVQFVWFCLCHWCFCVVSKKPLLNPVSQRYTVNSSKNFTVLALKFRFMIHFELIFVYDVSKSSNSFFCMNIQFLWHYLLKKLFYPLNYLHTLIKNQLTINVRVYLFLDTQFHFINLFVCP